MSRAPIVMSENDDPGGDTGVITESQAKTQRPPLYKVLLLNDDYTPMEFVVHVLERFFGMNHAHAFELMHTVHKKGVAVVGVFSFEIAETNYESGATTKRKLIAEREYYKYIHFATVENEQVYCYLTD